MAKTVLINALDIIPMGTHGYTTGIGRVNRGMLRAMATINDPDINIEIYCEQTQAPRYDGAEWPFKYHRFILPGRIFNATPIEQWWRRLTCTYDLLHLTANFGSVDAKEKFVVTVHDVLMLNARPYYKRPFTNSVRRSRAIATCSEHTKGDIIKAFGVPADKISVIPWGIDHTFFYPRSNEEIIVVKARYGISGNYFFACSCDSPRKNARYVVAAFRQYLRHNGDGTLVMAWHHPPQEILDTYADELREGRLRLIGDVSDNDLAALYAGALATFFVSSYEGFGFPILESLACGTPCVTCHNSSLPEVGGDKACYVKEKDADAIADAMFNYAHNGKGDTAALTAHARRFSWDTAVRQYLDLYKRCIY